MYYPRELIDEIRLQNDIVDVISGYVPLHSIIDVRLIL